jgi:HemY protein
MRSVIWLVLLAVVAVVAASVLGANEGLVSIYWAPWRVDVSLNLFVLLLVLGVSAAWLVAQALDALLGLPRRAREWRALQRERAANSALREALAHSFAGRYSRGHKAAQRAIDIQRQTPELHADAEFTVLAQLLGAASLHRLQDRVRRDHLLQQALDTSDRLGGSGRPLSEGAHLVAAEWAIDDREPTRALTFLGALPPGASRRTRALRLKLQAARAARQPLEALRTARMLAKHQGFTPDAAQGLLRSLAIEVLSQARDADQLRRY